MPEIAFNQGNGEGYLSALGPDTSLPYPTFVYDIAIDDGAIDYLTTMLDARYVANPGFGLIDFLEVSLGKKCKRKYFQTNNPNFELLGYNPDAPHSLPTLEPLKFSHYDFNFFKAHYDCDLSDRNYEDTEYVIDVFLENIIECPLLRTTDFTWFDLIPS